MRVAVIGIGHVGLVTAGALARWGHDVVGIDHDVDKVATLERGEMPFHEPGLPELIAEGVAGGRLSFGTSTADAVGGAEALFVCVGTPSLPGGGPDLRFVEAVGRDVATHADRETVLIEKSTVPANTGARLRTLVAREQHRLSRSVVVHVASNPEFLREGSAVADTLHPDRVVYGTQDEVARDVLRRIYAPLVEADATPVVETDVATAELIKHASNAFLATRISFINTVAAICDEVGADVTTVAAGMGHDVRIGPHFLQAGLGYGGSCFPKDVDAFLHLAESLGIDFTILEGAHRTNLAQRDRVLGKLRTELWHLTGKTVTLLGAAFKPGTDDLREAPALHLARLLLAEGATVRIYDPVALPGVAQQAPELERFDDPVAALRGAHAAVVCTEWPEVTELKPEVFLAELDYPIVIDGRNAFDPDEMIEAGLRYHGVGRRSVDPLG